jgi:hypothetical protein
MELKSADGRGAVINLPSSIKSIVLCAPETNYQKHRIWFSEPRVNSLYLNIRERTQLEL